MSEYITVAGIVQFDPRTRTAAGKEVRDVAIRSVANNKMISITLWPEMQSTSVNKGDFIVADGKYSQSMGQNKDGEQTTYHNLSATTFHNITGNGTTTSPAVKAAVSSDTGDDFPF
jgi:hypothetical protein